MQKIKGQSFSIPVDPARNVQHVNIKQFNSQFGCSTSKHTSCYNRELKARLHEYTTSDTISLRTEYLVAKYSGSNESFEVSKITRKGRYALMDCYFELLLLYLGEVARGKLKSM